VYNLMLDDPKETLVPLAKGLGGLPSVERCSGREWECHEEPEIISTVSGCRARNFNPTRKPSGVSRVEIIRPRIPIRSSLLPSRRPKPLQCLQSVPGDDGAFPDFQPCTVADHVASAEDKRPFVGPVEDKFVTGGQGHGPEIRKQIAEPGCDRHTIHSSNLRLFPSHHLYALAAWGLRLSPYEPASLRRANVQPKAARGKTRRGL
jgi:hypothetical protein